MSREADMREASSFFKVLAHEERLRMLWLLFNRPELCVCDFTALLGITQSKASRHLRILLGAGLVNDRRAGLWVNYSLRPAADPLVTAHLETLRRTLAGRREAAPLLQALELRLESRQAGARCD
jgi:ArsR family transcriptional regulator